MQGINNKILRVDLTKKEFKIEEPGEKFYRKYIGGRGFALYYMLKEMEPGIEPFSPDNMLVFASSIIGGVTAPAIPRLTVCGKSPLTGGFGEAEAGGFWAPELKKAGYDAVIVTGKAEKPVYLWLKDGEVVFKVADHLWGKETGDAQSLIREELAEDKARIVQIGPGGENLVRYAGITNELAHFNGRTGLGAVMGSKNLKAIAVWGTEKLEVGDIDKIREVARWAATEGLKDPMAEGLHELGTVALVNSFNEQGILPTRNWHKGQMEGADKISGETMRDTIGKEARGCYSCPIRCKRVVEVNDESMKVDPKYGGPEYETVGSFGSTLEIDDLKLIAKANELCNRYTLDTISTGMTIAFAMDCFENGLLTREDCDGLELTFGNKEVVLPLIQKIALREGIGDLLAEGSLRAARKIGKGAEKYLRQVKGQEIPMHDPRVKTGVGLSYAVADYGADHMKAPHDPFYTDEDAVGLRTTKALGIYDPVPAASLGKEKVRLYKYLDMYWSMLDMLGACDFGYVPRGPVPLDKLIDLVQAVTGEDISLMELMTAAERTINMARMFNIREGFSSKDDVLPEVFYEDFIAGPSAGSGGIDREEFNEALKLRYKLMGWDEQTGEPKEEKLLDLGIDWVL